MNLNCYNSEENKAFRTVIEKILKDIFALESLNNKTFGLHKEQIQQKISMLKHQIEDLAVNHYSTYPESFFYGQFLKENDKNAKFIGHILKKAQRKARKSLALEQEQL